MTKLGDEDEPMMKTNTCRQSNLSIHVGIVLDGGNRTLHLSEVQDGEAMENWGWSDAEVEVKGVVNWYED